MIRTWKFFTTIRPKNCARLIQVSEFRKDSPTRIELSIFRRSLQPYAMYFITKTFSQFYNCCSLFFFAICIV